MIFQGGSGPPVHPPLWICTCQPKIKGHWETGPLLVCFPAYFIVTVTCSCTNLRSVLSLYITYNVRVTLIGSVIIDNQSILTWTEAWFTVAPDSLHHADQITINARYQSAIILKKRDLLPWKFYMRFMHKDHWVCVHKFTVLFCS